MIQKNSFDTQSQGSFAGTNLKYCALKNFVSKTKADLRRLPYSQKILLENLLRFEDGATVKEEDVLAIANWEAKATPSKEIQFRPSRIVLQDFTGVPAVADLAAMRGAIQRLGGDPAKINPLQPADLVIDHSVQVDHFGTPDAIQKNTEIEYQRNRERYEFLRWGQSAFKNFRVVPPETGIVHQVNLEYLSHLAMQGDGWLYPDTLVGTDSHTTMINGLGVVGWGVGGIEAEAAMLGQPITMLIPQVVGFKLNGKLPAGTTATDLVLMVVQMLREKGVVGKFVEFYGPGLKNLTLADRATIANMAPEYGATIGIFPVDEHTISYIELTGRKDTAQIAEAYYREQDLWFDPEIEPDFSDSLELDLSQVEPSLAGPSRPQDRVNLSQIRTDFVKRLPSLAKGDQKPSLDHQQHTESPNGQKFDLKNGSVVIAAITSCTNTSNPAGLIAAGLLAKKALELGLQTKPWVKTSLAPGSKVVTDYLKNSNLLSSLEELRFNLVGYGCTTCIGNSGPLPEHIQKSIIEGNLVACSVLSGNRNFEGRINPHVRANYLASPALVVAYALAGTINIDLSKDPIGEGSGKPVYLKDVWPTQDEIEKLVRETVNSNLFQKSYADVFSGNEAWKNLKFPSGDLYQWEEKSTYIKEPPFFSSMKLEADPVEDIQNARVLVLLKDSVTTDHISPAGSIQKDSPAGKYLIEQGVKPGDFNSFGSRRGNHEVMLRGTFGNVRLKNQLAPGTEGGFTKFLSSTEETDTTIFEASMRYQDEGTPLIVIAGKEYGTGSSRDWAAKGTLLLGVKAVIAQSFERIHRSNLIGMGVLPLQFEDGQSYESLGLSGKEVFHLSGLDALQPGQKLEVEAIGSNGEKIKFGVKTRVDTPNELEYYRNGGILPYVLRQSLKK